MSRVFSWDETGDLDEKFTKSSILTKKFLLGNNKRDLKQYFEKTRGFFGLCGSNS